MSKIESTNEKLMDDMLKILNENEETLLEEVQPAKPILDPVRCPFCSKFYSGRRNLRRHIKLLHPGLQDKPEKKRKFYLEEN